METAQQFSPIKLLILKSLKQKYPGFLGSSQLIEGLEVHEAANAISDLLLLGYIRLKPIAPKPSRRPRPKWQQQIPKAVTPFYQLTDTGKQLVESLSR